MRPEEMEKRLVQLEKMVNDNFADVNRANAKTVQNIADLASKVGRIVSGLNTINLATAAPVKSLERSFDRLDRASDNVGKIIDKRFKERTIDKAVERALDAFDKFDKTRRK